MSRNVERSRSITKSPELNEELDALLIQRGWSRNDWAQEAHVGVTTVGRVFDLEDPKGVSNRLFLKMASVLATNDEDKVAALRLAGLPVPLHSQLSFATMLTEEINKFELTPPNRRVLEQEVLAHTRLIGRMLEVAQEGRLPFNLERRRATAFPLSA